MKGFCKVNIGRMQKTIMLMTFGEPIIELLQTSIQHALPLFCMLCIMSGIYPLDNEKKTPARFSGSALCLTSGNKII